MNFGKPFTFVFDDPDWLKKLAMFALLGFASLIPGIGTLFMALVFYGVTIDIMRKVINKETPTLPALDIGKQFMDGVKMWVISLVYSLPMLVFGIVIAIIIVIGTAGGFIAMDGDNAGAAGAVAVIAWIIVACVVLLMVLYGLLIALIMPEIYARYAQFGTIKDALKFKVVFKTVFKKPVPYLLSFVGVVLMGIVGAVASSILASIGAIALGIGALYGMALAMIYMMLGYGHFYAQAHNLSTEEII